MRISPKYMKIADCYLYFAKDFLQNSDTSHDALTDMYSFETFGKPRIKYSQLQNNGMFNGYAIGKHWMDVTLAMWKEDVANGHLIKNEILSDQEIPEFAKTIVQKFVRNV